MMTDVLPVPSFTPTHTSSSFAGVLIPEVQITRGREKLAWEVNVVNEKREKLGREGTLSLPVMLLYGHQT